LRGQLANENGIMASSFPKMPFCERLCFQDVQQCNHDGKTTGAETFCGKVSLAMLKSVQALPPLAFLPSMELPLMFWYDRQPWMRTVE
jgi:hypothetical protein